MLVNGRRIAPYGLADNAQESFTNLDAIASEAIERIEILKDGASSIYGSDAIAGVINIILRNNYQGAKISTNYDGDGLADSSATQDHEAIGNAGRSRQRCHHRPHRAIPYIPIA